MAQTDWATHYNKPAGKCKLRDAGKIARAPFCFITWLFADESINLGRSVLR